MLCQHFFQKLLKNLCFYLTIISQHDFKNNIYRECCLTILHIINCASILSQVGLQVSKSKNK